MVEGDFIQESLYLVIKDVTEHMKIFQRLQKADWKRSQVR